MRDVALDQLATSLGLFDRLLRVASNVDGSYRPNVLAVSFRRFSLSKVSAVGLHRTTVHLQRAEELMMRTILVPTINSPAMKSTFETALLLATRTSAYIEGVPLWFGGPEFVVAEQASSFSMESASYSRPSCRRTVLLPDRPRTDLRLAGLPRYRRVKAWSGTVAVRSM